MVFFEDLMASVNSNDSKYDADKIESAYKIAEEAHSGQKRKSGEPYIIHPISVAMILVELGMDTDSIVAALLHDVVEDTDFSLGEIKSKFGEEVALLVDGVTKLGKIPYSSREEQQAENLRKMLIAMAKDVRVIIIKLADRLHNMRTLEFRDPQKQRDVALETMEVYTPIAHRLGIRTIKEELEDTALQYLDPVAYKEIETHLQLEKDDREKFLESIRQKIIERLSGSHTDTKVDGRVKSIYGIYRKMYIQGRSFDEIYDIYAVRVIVNDINECYNVLGEIHDMFRPIPNRFKDYISTPKPNMYQSLHTTVFDKASIPFEVQIRTWDMHNTAEYGIAAHWKYKIGIEGKDSLEDKIIWVRQLLENQQESVDVQEIVGSIKTDLSTDEVYVFTPKGDVIPLPVGATVIDFAYAIHSEVGNRMIGAKIDGRMVSLDTQVETGNIVSVITSNSPSHGPSRDWIKIVKTSSTRNKIRLWFKRERREENIEQGRADVEREFRKYNIILEPEEMQEFILKTAKNQRLNSIDDFYAAVGYGGILLSKIMVSVKEQYQRLYKTTAEEEIKKQLEKNASHNSKKASSGVIVEGLDSCLVKFARCCNPLPGDEIVGYITRGFGVSVHMADCVNVSLAKADLNQSERWVKCEWATEARSESFKSTLDIIGKDRPNFLLDISIVLNNLHIQVHSLVAREMPDSMTSIQISFSASSLDHLKNIINVLSKVSGVTKVIRTVQ